MQGSLFQSVVPTQIALHQGELALYENWLDASEADALLDLLCQQLRWEQSQIVLHGKSILIPRLNAWYGDRECGYSYSGHSMVLNHWIAPLSHLRSQLEQSLSLTFNSVLANLYRSGSDSVAWHSDDEPELGKDPIIASISLGASRRFSLKHRGDKSVPTVHVELSHGTLLVMSGSTQRFWQHCVPKTKKSVGPRLNLTFRRVVSTAQDDSL